MEESDALLSLRIALWSEWPSSLEGRLCKRLSQAFLDEELRLATSVGTERERGHDAPPQQVVPQAVPKPVEGTCLGVSGDGDAYDCDEVERLMRLHRRA